MLGSVEADCTLFSFLLFTPRQAAEGIVFVLSLDDLLFSSVFTDFTPKEFAVGGNIFFCFSLPFAYLFPLAF